MTLEDPTPIVVITGPPASGKTTIARALAASLSQPLIAKDDIKELLFDALGAADRAWSRRLGAATYRLVYHFLGEQLRAGRPVVVEGTFDPEAADQEFGELHARWPFDALQLFCTAPDDVLLARYGDRAATRHPGHVDASMGDEVHRALASGRWRPLSLPGRLLVVDTGTADADIGSLRRTAADHLRG